MSSSDLRERLLELADEEWPTRIDSWAPGVRERYARRRRRRVQVAVPATAIATATVVLTAGLASRVEHHDPATASAPAQAVLPNRLPDPTRTPPTLADRPIQAASMVVGWLHGDKAYDLLMDAKDGSFRLLPGAAGPVPKEQGAMPDTRCPVALSPDGTQTACSVEGGIRVTTLTTGRTRMLPVPGLTPSSPMSWSPDGSTIAVVTGGGMTHTGPGNRWKYVNKSTLHVVGLDGSHKAYALPVAAGFPAWSPDSSRIVVNSLRGRDGVRVVDVSAGTVTQVIAPVPATQQLPSAAHPAMVEQVLFTPDGSGVVGFTGGTPTMWTLSVFGLDGKLRSTRTVPLPHRQRVLRLSGWAGEQLVVSSELTAGTGMAVVPPHTALLQLLDRRTGQLTNLVVGGRDVGPGSAALGSGQRDGGWGAWPGQLAQSLLPRR